ncbi:Transcription factor [Parahypoxylon ruwenzoriense]
MESNGSHAKDKRPDSDAKSKDNTPTTSTTTTPPENINKSPKKRRKVNHAKIGPDLTPIEQERPCTRCIKRNIGHLCHDEPRDPDSKKSKGSHGSAGHDESEIQPEISQNSIDQSAAAMAPPSFDGTGAAQRTKQGFGAGALDQTNPLQLVSPNTASSMQASASGSNMSQFGGFSDAWLTAQNQFHDMHHYHPQYMLAPEVSHEFNLLNDFLNTSLLDDAGSLSDDQALLFRNNQSQPNHSDMVGYVSGNNSLLATSAMQTGSMPPPSTEHASSSGGPADKTREFYLQAADPSGNDTPEARMQRVMKAKYDAGLLKPFNYIKGYARLSSYMDGHIAPSSKQKILRQLDRFRPKFREKVQGLTDIELVYVEMWFERTLLEYDRVFAAMAVPACCWRRTGEIFRGNKEMAELIHVPVERLRDGKISLHEILTEESLVRYWEEFGTIAFDAAHDTLLTACALKNPDDRSNDPIVNCCFSFMIRRDDHKM